ncbi:MAG: DUF3040 domain-containing protein [Acidimicrobiales bacterium]
MPLSEDEQRILHEIEQQFYESDPAFAREVAKTTVYRHAGRNLKWAALGFFVGFVLLIASFSYSVVLGFASFLIMLACAFVFERNLRKMGKAGWKQVSESVKVSNFKEALGETGKKFRKRFKKDE